MLRQTAFLLRKQRSYPQSYAGIEFKTDEVGEIYIDIIFHNLPKLDLLDSIFKAAFLKIVIPFISVVVRLSTSTRTPVNLFSQAVALLEEKIEESQTKIVWTSESCCASVIYSDNRIKAKYTAVAPKLSWGLSRGRLRSPSCCHL